MSRPPRLNRKLRFAAPRDLRRLPALKNRLLTNLSRPLRLSPSRHPPLPRKRRLRKRTGRALCRFVPRFWDAAFRSSRP